MSATAAPRLDLDELGLPAPDRLDGTVGLIESLAGVDFPPDDPPPRLTLGDAHRHSGALSHLAGAAS